MYLRSLMIRHLDEYLQTNIWVQQVDPTQSEVEIALRAQLQTGTTTSCADDYHAMLLATDVPVQATTLRPFLDEASMLRRPVTKGVTTSGYQRSTVGIYVSRQL